MSKPNLNLREHLQLLFAATLLHFFQKRFWNCLNRYLIDFDSCPEAHLHALHISAFTNTFRAISRWIRIFIIMALLADDDCLRKYSQRSRDRRLQTQWLLCSYFWWPMVTLERSFNIELQETLCARGVWKGTLLREEGSRERRRKFRFEHSAGYVIERGKANIVQIGHWRRKNDDLSFGMMSKQSFRSFRIFCVSFFGWHKKKNPQNTEEVR